jgi:hypothetical protein
MGFKIYATMREMRAFAEASVCRGKHFVSPHGHERPHLFLCPASLPTARCYKKNGQRTHLTVGTSDQRVRPMLPR